MARSKTIKSSEEELEAQIKDRISSICDDLKKLVREYLTDSDLTRNQYLHLIRTCDEIVAEIDQMYDVVEDYDI